MRSTCPTDRSSGESRRARFASKIRSLLLDEPYIFVEIFESVSPGTTV
jgi:hypothetical protein